MAIAERARSAWNAFFSVGQNTQGPPFNNAPEFQMAAFGGASPARPVLRFQSEKSIIASIYNRISIDFASVPMRHVKYDEFHRYHDDIQSKLNYCLTWEPNLDQGPRHWRQDIAMTLFDKGSCAIVPVDTIRDAETGEVLEILSIRVGEVLNWYAGHVKVKLYNEANGKYQDVVLPKRSVAIVENPLFAVMNGPNSTLQRLIRTLGFLDAVGEQSSSGKLDIIIQLPYTIKSDARREQANRRRDDIEMQLKGSQYGIAYADSTEKITQLNRPAENNLLNQVKYLTEMLYAQLGITEEVMNGTADEPTMINYFNRTIEPILTSVVEAMQRSFLGMKGTMNQEGIAFFRDPFKLVPLSQFADIADKLGRNEVATSNELRGFVGIQPHPDPKADELVNSNMPPQEAAVPNETTDPTEPVA